MYVEGENGLHSIVYGIMTLLLHVS